MDQAHIRKYLYQSHTRSHFKSDGDDDSHFKMSMMYSPLFARCGCWMKRRAFLKYCIEADEAAGLYPTRLLERRKKWKRKTKALSSLLVCTHGFAVTGFFVLVVVLVFRKLCNPFIDLER
jgi:hypothetical protein